MTRCILIALAAISWAVIHPAKAFANCEMVDEVVATLPLVKRLQNEPELILDRDVTRELSLRLDRISLEDLQPLTYQMSFASESLSLSNYVSGVKDALAGVDVGNSSYARWILNNQVSTEIGRPIETLGRHWKCEETDANNAETEISSTLARNSFDNEGNAADESRTAPSAPVPGRSSNQSVTANKGDLSPAKIDRRQNLQVDYFILLLMAVMTVLIVTYLVKRRPKKRAVRRIIHRPAQVKLGPSSHAMTIIDITVNGCKIGHPDKITKERKLQVQLEGQWYSGQIKWANAQFAGVMFTRPLSQSVFNKVVADRPADSSAESAAAPHTQAYPQAHPTALKSAGTT